MKFAPHFIPYLTFRLAYFPHSTIAFIEPDATTQTEVALASFVDSSSLPRPDTAFFQSSDQDVPSSFTPNLSVLEDRFGLKPGSTIVDARSGKVASLHLKQPILPGGGVGNNLLWSVGSGYDAPTSTEEWSKLGVDVVKNWLLDHQAILQIDAANEIFPSQSLLFDEASSSESNVRTAVHGDDGDMIQISMQRTFKGVKVVGSRASATIKSGNLINVGFEHWGEIDERFDVEPRLTEQDAYDAVAIHTGLTLIDDVTCKPELQIKTISQDDIRSTSLRPSSSKEAAFGQGYAHRLVWRVCPKFEGQSVEKMEGIVDAITGKVLSFQDTVDYFQAKGDVYPFSNDGIGPEGSLQLDWPMPFMQVGSAMTDSGGNFNLVGSQTARLSGQYVEMRDMCGTEYTVGSDTYGIASLTQSNGIDWGGSSGTDCATPGFGGTSNTHASRSGFYELNRIIEIARSRLPSNTWLQGKLLSYMNIGSTCNAYWDGDVNFYRSGGGCRNTGEIAGVFDHEWGHGLDNNDVTGQIANPSGEGIADLYAALRLNDSCIGRGFFQSGVCSGNGNPCVTCTGVRDIDYMKRSNKTPSTFTWANSVCNDSVHCLGYVYSEAVWSLYKRELNSFYGYDENTSLEIVTRLTYIAAGNIETWYGGYTQSESGIWRGGCGSSSGYLAYLAADDDNGNIDDGTPHMQAIFKSFNDQQIACDTPTVQDSGCSATPTDAPIVTVVGGNTKATLTWTAVTGASKYQVLRTEGTRQCGQGKVLLATLNSSIRTYTDANLSNGREYFYIVVPKGSNDACFGPSSSCAAVTPDAVSGLDMTCDTSPVNIPLDPGQSPPAQYRNCVLRGIGGFTGTVNLSCGTSSLSGVTCAVSPTSVTVSSTSTSPVVSIQASSSAVGGTGSILVSASGGSASASSAISVTVVPAGGSQVAEFDSTYGAPRCVLWGAECSSANLLNGRGSLTGGNEQNAPNTIDNCQDGNSGAYHVDESIDKIVVRSGYVNGDGLGATMVKGGRVTIIATVYAYSAFSSDYADFYYASDVDPSWKFISTKQPSGGGVRQILVDYELPQASIHMVRVNFRYNGAASSCTSGSYNDHDDLVFAVFDSVTSPPVTLAPVTPPPSTAPSKKPTPQPTDSPTRKPTMKPTSPPTNSPVTPKPTNSPTNSPTKKPTSSPTKKPTTAPSKIPTSEPTSKPTLAPSNKPTSSPTAKPTQKPSYSPSKRPTDQPSKPPTNLPTSSPVTSSPTKPNQTNYPTGAPITSSPTSPPSAQPMTLQPSKTPTNSPTSAAPSQKPTAKPTSNPTSHPTSSPVTASPTSSGSGPQDASFDSIFGAPRCTLPGSSCSSGSLVKGRGNFFAGVEPNQPNTIDGCFDGSSGTYQTDESIEQVVVRSGEIDGSGSDVDMVVGGRATIIASVFAWNTGASDTADFFYTSDASSPNWQYIGSITPPGGQGQDLKIAYTLPQGSNQAVRVQFRYQGTIAACSYGAYNDRDDLVFAVKSAPNQPTQAPSLTPPPTQPAGGGPQQASYDSVLTVPRCGLYGSECDSLNFLKGRGKLRNGNELNRPNTLDSCVDGNAGTYYSDESLEQIIVRSGEVDGSGSGVDMAEGGRVTIVATVYPWSTGTSDYADFYYASDSSNPIWQYIGTKRPSGGGLQQLKISYSLPTGKNQAVRVNFRYKGSQGTNGACSAGNYDDSDDLAFSVKANPAFTGVVTDPVVNVDIPKDADADALKRAELAINESGKRRGKAAKRM
ncbi:hypothetical protein HJC23_012735 [Cyclotella cryptica]|uniref:Fibronectin type-III domain-containing protein n=1 Tax=Cyclotella cryptica TaxID=29204 RepID=A0ABD3P823_9STRA|eukprot:CCRYP_016771-RA/>CCRYP_016771-RA protein AED:0.05 eAED:0.05 QI:451/1/1/1/0.86/0.81/16/1632/1737